MIHRSEKIFFFKIVYTARGFILNLSETDSCVAVKVAVKLSLGKEISPCIGGYMS